MNKIMVSRTEQRKIEHRIRQIKSSLKEVEENIDKCPSGKAFETLLDDLGDISDKLFDIACFQLDI